MLWSLGTRYCPNDPFRNVPPFDPFTAACRRPHSGFSRDGRRAARRLAGGTLYDAQPYFFVRHLPRGLSHGRIIARKTLRADPRGRRLPPFFDPSAPLEARPAGGAIHGGRIPPFAARGDYPAIPPHDRRRSGISLRKPRLCQYGRDRLHAAPQAHR